MFPNLGFGEILVILVVALLIFGPSKLPQLGKAAGQTLREFKRGVRDVIDDDRDKQAKKESK
ncbi:twin-arginine translocase TatA/TatE family subunit [Heyndrickxia ginsengihumi]|uniref:Sec-independent protein translocase protein TatA n=1 Tax=Heyndrickxia ginsengihumi TaxID=363870 RepID=A0A0A6VBN8_9BACI|nr:twin-arginine translocase TatA/TatE family subunit [Heyndrickxia ginsengihumi]KHD84903.1 translocase [Heyndrickxia ginsengihumi]MBE6184388.1 twin-arginine translocase TatA/TatE family subunit [Bacillus sp. (in: firmicutes)]MCM3023125.1 twin-arginine translocase TatA/TatE family subunit [Heyndrickxia ginsengihumi]NEY19963.1 twin-arginine translocase TatA/TatE family subunit [Heyndrickxia ginsengihumi]